MRQRSGWRWLASIIGIIAIILLCVISVASVLVLWSGLFPSTEMHGQLYLNAIKSGNGRAAASLAFFNGECSNVLEQGAQRDIAKFGSAEIHNVRIGVEASGAGDEEIEYAIIKFEYRKSAQSEWQPGEMKLVTARPAGLGFRYLCGNIKYHPP